MSSKTNVAGFSMAIAGKLVLCIRRSLSRNIVASCSSLCGLSLLVKYQARITKLLIPSSNDHCIFAVDPGKKVNHFPPGGR